MTGEAHHRCLEAGWSELEGIGAARLFTFAVRRAGAPHGPESGHTVRRSDRSVCFTEGTNTTVHVNGVAS
jgi:hypothetical protein